MSLPTTDQDVANMALANLGHTVQIANLATDSTNEAKNARLFLDSERDQCLAGYRWKWAEKRAVLAELTGTGAWWDNVDKDWSRVYALPADCVQPRILWPGTRNPASEDTEPFDLTLDSAGTAKVLLCDVAPVTTSPNQAPVLFYTQRVTSVALYPQPFVSFLAWALAAKLCVPVQRESGVLKLASVLEMRALMFREAWRFDFQSYRPDQPPPSPSIAARGLSASTWRRRFP